MIQIRTAVSRSLALVLLVGAAVPRTGQGQLQSEEARAQQVLSRLTFGARFGDVDRVLAIGVDRWIDQQLHPETVADSGAARALGTTSNWYWTGPIDSVLVVAGRARPITGAQIRDSAPVMIMGGLKARQQRNPAFLLAYQPPLYNELVTSQSAPSLQNPEGRLELSRIVAGRFTRAEFSDQQLVEVLTDFWENHFSVYGPKGAFLASIIEWDRAVVRPRVFGRFRELLGAVAHSNAMIAYLDNGLNVAGANNENYARELLERHTMGADGGYTQRDVMEVARAFTGWNSSLRADAYKAEFRFDSARHDTSAKAVLGHALAPGRGIEDGEEVLDLIARHPSTAHYVARKLAVRFVSDDPPDALVDRAAQVFLRTDGDLREVTRAIITSPEFVATVNVRVKTKTPVELVLSARRALGAPVDSGVSVIDQLITLGQQPYGRLTPDGWPETGAPWMAAGAMRDRVAFAVRIGAGEIPSIPVEAWPAWTRLAAAPADQQTAAIIREILGGVVSADTRAALLATRASTGGQRLREMLTLALCSPEFQRR